MNKVMDKFRSVVLVLFSAVLWIFCFTAFATIILSIFNINTYYTQLVRILMNVNVVEIQFLAEILVYASGVILIYLLVAGYFNRLKTRQGGYKSDKYKKSF